MNLSVVRCLWCRRVGVAQRRRHLRIRKRRRSATFHPPQLEVDLTTWHARSVVLKYAVPTPGNWIPHEVPHSEADARSRLDRRRPAATSPASGCVCYQEAAHQRYLPPLILSRHRNPTSWIAARSMASGSRMRCENTPGSLMASRTRPSAFWTRIRSRSRRDWSRRLNRDQPDSDFRSCSPPGVKGCLSSSASPRRSAPALEKSLRAIKGTLVLVGEIRNGAFRLQAAWRITFKEWGKTNCSGSQSGRTRRFGLPHLMTTANRRKRRSHLRWRSSRHGGRLC